MSHVISKIDPYNVPFEYASFLQKAIKKNPLPDDPDLLDIIDNAKHGNGEIYAIGDVGCLYAEFLPEIMHVALLGADNILSIRDGLEDWAKSLMKDRGIRYFSILGRASWHKIFTELKPVGTFYQYDGG